MSHHLERARAAESRSLVVSQRAVRAVARAQGAEAAALRAASAAGRAIRLSAARLHQQAAERQQRVAWMLRSQAALEQQHEDEHGDDPMVAAADEAR